MRKNARRRSAFMLARAARIATASLLFVCLAGVPPMSVLCSIPRPQCGDMCSRCHCKGHSASEGLRAPCPCCDPRGGAHDGITTESPAILVNVADASAPVAPRAAFTAAVESRLSLSRDVPHPPPRTPLSRVS